jgi:pimeloyl-ACP methyl ester carboxylesterase
VLLIWGAEDQITPVWDELPAGVQVEIIPHAGHLCYLEQPDRFNAVVKRFIADYS